MDQKRNQGEIRKYFKMKKKRETLSKHMGCTTAVHRDKCTVVTTYIRKKKVLRSRTSTSTLRNLKKKSKLNEGIKAK